jgi:hypothetical protein
MEQSNKFRIEIDAKWTDPVGPDANQHFYIAGVDHGSVSKGNDGKWYWQVDNCKFEGACYYDDHAKSAVIEALGAKIVNS